MSLCGVILAGGKGSRMGGRDKGGLILGDRSLYDRVIDRLGPQVDRLAINANTENDGLLEYGLSVLPDVIPGQLGPLAGVLTAMEWAAANGFDSVVTAAADTPFFPETLVMNLRLGARQNGAAIAIAAERGEGPLRSHPTFGLWSTRLRDDLRASLLAGHRRMRDFTEAHGAVQVVFDQGAFFNINTPEDLTEAEARLRKG